MLSINYDEKLLISKGKITKLGKLETNLCRLFFEKFNHKVSFFEIIKELYGVDIREYNKMSPRQKDSVNVKARKLMSRVRDKIKIISDGYWMLNISGGRYYYFSEIDLITDLLRRQENAYFLNNMFGNSGDFNHRLFMLEEAPSYFEKTFRDNVCPSDEG